MSFDVILTTYKVFVLDAPLLRSLHWWRVVIDEAQLLRAPASQQSKGIIALVADNKWALTGTPVPSAAAFCAIDGTPFSDQ